jgi:fused signal recognition particle receptor
MHMSFAEKIKKLFSSSPKVSEEFFEDLSDLLVEGDFGAAEAYKTVDALREYCKKKNIREGEEGRGSLRKALADILEGQLISGKYTANTGEGGPSEKGLTIILLLGVNGVGKTTTAAKLAKLFRDQEGYKPLLAAADTFRAAAIDQLKIHGERLGVRVIAHKHGGDPAAVVYDAIEAARGGGGDLIIADTAGRMHTKSALVEELRKIDRVVESRSAGTRYIKYLVLDATTGRNALAQAEIFHEAVNLDGVILTKYDSSARGGVVFSLAQDLHLPVVYLCNGEQYPDIQIFDPRLYAERFSGLE